MYKYVKFPFQFDSIALQKDVIAITKDQWKPHYNTKHYEGKWNIIPLQSIDGSIENLFSIQTKHNSHLQYHPTIFLEKSIYIQQLLKQLECEKTSIRLMQLEAGAVIKPHSDYDMSFEDGEIRLHVPVFTHQDVDFFLKDEKITMLEGECWYLNLTLMHSVHNKSNIDRVHLVIDCKVNDFIRKIFDDATLIKKEVEEKDLQQQFSTIEKDKIILELRKQNTPLSNQLADELALHNRNDYA